MTQAQINEATDILVSNQLLKRQVDLLQKENRTLRGRLNDVMELSETLKTLAAT